MQNSKSLVRLKLLFAVVNWFSNIFFLPDTKTSTNSLLPSVIIKVQHLVLQKPNTFLISVDVPDSPSPPEVSDITTNSLKLSWRAPKDGHSPIINYVVEYRKTGEKDWTLVPGDVVSTTYLVEDLTPRTSYRFRISAVNKIGSSRPSRFSGLVETKR